MVRSDFTVTLKIMNADGHFEALGGHSVADTELDDSEEAVPVPHLHREDADGRWLASWDSWRRRLHIRDLRGGGKSHSLKVSGLGGEVQKMRWLGDSSGVVMLTTRQAYVLRFDPNEQEPDTWASPLLGRAPRGANRVMKDVGMQRHGLVIRTAQYSTGSHHAAGKKRAQVAYHVSVGANRVGPARRVSPTDRTLTGMTVLSGDRVVLSLAGADLEPGELRVLAIRSGAHVTLLDSIACITSDCDVVNWSPHTRRLAYQVADGRVVVRVDAGKDRGATEDRVLSLRRVQTADTMHTLWLSPDEERVLVGGSDGYVIADVQTGRVLTDWTPQDYAVMTSARFDKDGRSVLAAAGRSAYRVDASGRSRRLLQTRKPTADATPTHGAVLETHTFVDDIIPLGGGALAYSVVRLQIEEDYNDEEPEFYGDDAEALE